MSFLKARQYLSFMRTLVEFSRNKRTEVRRGETKMETLNAR